MARVVITAVVVEGRSKSEVARDYGVSRRWVQTLVARYQAEGEAAFEPHSRRPRSNPRRIAGTLEDRIVQLRKELTEAGHDAGAETIAWHLTQPTDPRRQSRRSGGPLPAAGSSTPSRTNGPAHPGNGSKPNSPTKSGKPTSPARLLVHW